MPGRLIALMTLLLCASAMSLAAPPAQLEAIINRRIADPALQGAQVGILVQSLDNGDIWYARNADASFIPASNAKVITAILALEYLRPEYRFTTRLLTAGTITDGVLQGDLYLQGGGDPSLTGEELRAMAHALAMGDPARHIPPIHQVNGRLLLDCSFFPRSGPLVNADWEAGDLPWYYAAPACALSCHRNAVTVTVRGTAAGQRPQVITTPDTGLFNIRNHAMTSAHVNTGAVEVSRSGSVISVAGNVAPGVELEERLSVPNPERFTGEQLRNALRAENISTSEMTDSAADAKQCTVLVEHRSLPLADLVVTMLKESDNHFAEQLRWTLLSLYSRERPLDERYEAMLRDFSAHSGLPFNGLTLVDGSGLSRHNRVSPYAMVRMLTYMALSPNYATFYQALPVAGVDGTLRKRMTDGPACTNCHAKTGTMRGVSALSGYLHNAQGERLVFCIFVNGYSRGAAVARRLQDDIVEELAGCSSVPSTRGNQIAHH